MQEQPEHFDVHLSVDEGCWTLVPGRVHVVCGTTARRHPETSLILGCEVCGITASAACCYWISRGQLN